MNTDSSPHVNSRVSCWSTHSRLCLFNLICLTARQSDLLSFISRGARLCEAPFKIKKIFSRLCVQAAGGRSNNTPTSFNQMKTGDERVLLCVRHRETLISCRTSSEDLLPASSALSYGPDCREI